MNNFKQPLFALVLAGAAWGAAAAGAVTLTITGSDGKPLPTVMVTQSLTQPVKADSSDHGYAAPGTLQRSDQQVTRFTNERGQAVLRKSVV